MDERDFMTTNCQPSLHAAKPRRRTAPAASTAFYKALGFETIGLMLSLAMDSREAVDAMSRTAAAHGRQPDASPAEDFGYMYSRDLADPDGHLWAVFWMDPTATPAAAGT